MSFPNFLLPIKFSRHQPNSDTLWNLDLNRNKVPDSSPTSKMLFPKSDFQSPQNISKTALQTEHMAPKALHKKKEKHNKKVLFPCCSSSSSSGLILDQSSISFAYEAFPPSSGIVVKSRSLFTSLSTNPKVQSEADSIVPCLF